MLLYPKPLRVLKAISSESMQTDPGSINTEDEVLAEPDVPGLWSKESYQPHQVIAFLHRVLGQGHTEPH